MLYEKSHNKKKEYNSIYNNFCVIALIVTYAEHNICGSIEKRVIRYVK